MKLQTIVDVLRPLAVKGSLDHEIRGISCDSRQIRPGHLFAAMPGQHYDGATFVDDAVKRGAAAIVSVVGVPSSPAATHVYVGDIRQAVADIACTFHGRPSSKMRVVGITGTNGKTTVSFMVRDILAAAGLTPGLVGTVQYRIGARDIPAGRTTPQAMELQAMLDQMVQVGCRSVAMEVSSHALDQKRVWGVDFDVAAFTNLTHDHLDYHGTMERYFEAKRLLFEWLGRGEKPAVAVVNIDDPYGRRLAEMKDLPAKCITYGCDPKAMVRAADIELSAKGSVFRLVTPWGESRLRLKLLGRFNISNALAAAAACGAAGIELAVIDSVLSRVVSVPGRLEEIQARRDFHVFVDYAHTDDALQNVLRTLREITPGRLILVFGCGGNRDRLKRPAMGAVAAELADHSILTSDNPRREDPAEIILQIRQGFGDKTNFEIEEDRAEAIRKAVVMAEKGDVVLIAGKGHETFQEFANTVTPFDDREVVRKRLA